jgi:hypothetical protein
VQRRRRARNPRPPNRPEARRVYRRARVFRHGAPRRPMHYSACPTVQDAGLAAGGIDCPSISARYPRCRDAVCFALAETVKR